MSTMAHMKSNRRSLPDRLQFIETVPEDSELDTLSEQFANKMRPSASDNHLTNGNGDHTTGSNGISHGSPNRHGKMPPRVSVKNHRINKQTSPTKENTYFVNENGKPLRPLEDDRTLRFVGRRGLAVGDGEDITSSKGTVRGVKNRVRAGIANFTYKPLDYSRKYMPVNNQDEVGKIIIYTTSMRIVRQTFDDCQFVRKLFQNHRVRFEERDLFMNIEYQRELQERLGEDQPITLPIVFIDGALIGDVERLEELNESGQLRKILERFEKFNPTSNCATCGGFRYTPCTTCNGSKKSLLRNNWTDHFHALRCTYCDDNGLQRCRDCNK
ncbi:glutaredoxin domain-containing cysteine-rich protein 1-like [Amphiura filiformis]|uniref:glutaredoxin domain-containing cysteine-rich protein 1-like n=1 Tax=Amphiura filiformis TaxID=82378 RepID=UPI003B214E77